MKILYFCNGEGLGHATRAIAAAKGLVKQNEVKFASYGYAKDFLEKNGHGVLETFSEVQMTGESGALDIKKSTLTTLKNFSPGGFLKVDKAIKEQKPDLIISDCYFNPIFHAKSAKIPFWLIANQTNTENFFSNSTAEMKLIGNGIKGIGESALKSVDKILIPDFAPPFTICSKNISNITPELSEKVVYLGPLIRQNSAEIEVKESDNTVFSSIGGFGYRKALLDRVVKVSKRLQSFNFHVVAGPNSEKLEAGQNLMTYGLVPNPLELIARSSVVVCGGGHSTIMEAISLGKPVLSCPDKFHFEQQSNALKMQELGLGTMIDYDTPEVMLEELIVDHSSNQEMKKRLRSIMRFARELDGKKRLAELAQEQALKA